LTVFGSDLAIIHKIIPRFSAISRQAVGQVGVVDSGRGLETTFEFVGELSDRCRFKDCTHTSERGCAVKEAVENGDVERAAYENYLKMQKERDFFEASELEKNWDHYTKKVILPWI
jgi:ribosome biogenesis GTPase